jgi:retron-type reverse transcriptase
LTAPVSQFERFLSIENFRLALRRIQTSQPNLYKSLYSNDLRVFSFFEQDNLEFLIHLIRDGSYEPKPCDRIYVPKDKNLVRPLSVLCCVDQIVYQALINIIADEFYDFFLPLWNRTIFGNVYRHSSDPSAIFFNVEWKKQWSRYNRQTEANHLAGYYYFADFDFASYFDTIDHEILCQILDNHGIEREILDLLGSCLKTWTLVNNREKYKCNHGIPQGPLASHFLADVYLTPLDNEIAYRSRLDIKYSRYVDDIRILAKNDLEGQKTVMLIDLLARDFGLIPRPDKVSVYRVDDIRRKLNRIDNKFSQINNIFRRDRNLPAKVHNQLKRHFLRCFEKGSDEFLNKTTLRFALFKLNKDDRIRDVLLENLELLEPFFEGVSFYLNTHYRNNKRFLDWILDRLQHDHILVQHLTALIFRGNPSLKFDERVYFKHFVNNHQFWLTKYFVLDWLDKNSKVDLIKGLTFQDNHFVNQKLAKLKLQTFNDDFAKQLFIQDLLASQDEMLALFGLYFRAQDIWLVAPQQPDLPEHANPYVRNIVVNQKVEFVNRFLKESFNVVEPDKFFNDDIWLDAALRNALKTEFSLFVRKRKSDPSGSLMALDLFNEMVFRKMCELLGRPVSGDFGGAIDVLGLDFPFARIGFRKIHQARSERTDAHYMDSRGNIRVRIKFHEYEYLISRCKLDRVFNEICSHDYARAATV